MTANGNNKEVRFTADDTIPQDGERKKPRMWVFSASIMIHNEQNVAPPMPLDVDNGLPGIELWFGNNADNEMGFLCHMDTCAAMNTGNLAVHQWLMSTHPHLVAEYIQFDDITPFEPLRLHCAVADLAKTESMHGKLTAIVRYWLRYKNDGKNIILSFGLGASVTVNSIIGIPTIKAWKCLFDFDSHELIARGLNTKFPLVYEATRQGLPPGVDFKDENFVRPLKGAVHVVTALLTNAPHVGNIKKPPSSMVTQTTSDGCTRRYAGTSHIN